MNWINKRNLPAIEAIKYNDRLCIEFEDLWSILHSSFNMAQDYHIDFDALNKVSNKHPTEWVFFSREKFISTIAKCNNSSTPGPNKIFWRHLNYIVKDKSCLEKIINIANACFELGH